MSFVIWFLRVRCPSQHQAYTLPHTHADPRTLLQLLLLLPITSATAATTTNRIVCTFCMQHAVRMRNRNRSKSVALHVMLHVSCSRPSLPPALLLLHLFTGHICRSHLTILLICFVQHKSARTEIKTKRVASSVRTCTERKMAASKLCDINI